MFQVTLYKNPPIVPGGGGDYSMKIALLWKTDFNCVANVAATSGVVYGSQGTQFVTLVLKAGTTSTKGPP